MNKQGLNGFSPVKAFEFKWVIPFSAKRKEPRATILGIDRLFFPVAELYISVRRSGVEDASE
jgi:hypothetical protein